MLRPSTLFDMCVFEWVSEIGGVIVNEARNSELVWKLPWVPVESIKSEGTACHHGPKSFVLRMCGAQLGAIEEGTNQFLGEIVQRNKFFFFFF